MSGVAPAVTADMLTTSHAMTCRITAYPPGGGVLPVTGLTGGSVTYNASQNVRRQASLTFAPTEDLWPYGDGTGSVLSPYGTDLQIDYGIVAPGGAVEWVPLMYGPILSAQRTVPAGTSGIAVTVSDRAQRIADDRLVGSQAVAAGSDITTTITQIVQATLPGVTVTDLTGAARVTSGSVNIQQDRLGSCVNLALAKAAVFYADRTGGFVLAPQASPADPPRWTVTSGRGGALITSQETADRSLMFNTVTAYGSSSSNTAAVSATVYDDDPASPTRYGGPAGRVPRFYTSPLLTTVDQCAATAQAILDKTRGNHTKLQISMVPNPFIDVDDVIIARYRGRQYQVVADQISVPLTPGSAMSITTRGSYLPPESDPVYQSAGGAA